MVHGKFSVYNVLGYYFQVSHLHLIEPPEVFDTQQASGNAIKSPLNLYVEITYPNGAMYWGSCKNGKPHGSGRMKYQNGDFYSGEWEKGEKCGIGNYNSPRQAFKYNGEWKADKFHGVGIQEHHDGTVYRCHYQHGKKEGFGICEFSNSDYFEGGFKNDKVEGFGAYRKKTGPDYEGYWKDGLLDGVARNSEDSRRPFSNDAKTFNQKEYAVWTKGEKIAIIDVKRARNISKPIIETPSNLAAFDRINEQAMLPPMFDQKILEMEEERKRIKGDMEIRRIS